MGVFGDFKVPLCLPDQLRTLGGDTVQNTKRSDGTIAFLVSGTAERQRSSNSVVRLTGFLVRNINDLALNTLAWTGQDSGLVQPQLILLLVYFRPLIKAPQRYFSMVHSNVPTTHVHLVLITVSRSTMGLVS